MRLLHLRGDQIELSLRVLKGYLRLQTPKYRQSVAISISLLADWKRQEKIYSSARGKHRPEIERGRQNTNHRGGLVIERDRLSDNSRIRTKSTHPKAVAQQHRALAVPYAFSIFESTSSLGFDSEKIEEVLRYPNASQALGFSAAGQGIAAVVKEGEVRGQILERLIGAPPVLEVSDLSRNRG